MAIISVVPLCDSLTPNPMTCDPLQSNQPMTEAKGGDRNKERQRGRGREGEKG